MLLAQLWVSNNAPAVLDILQRSVTVTIFAENRHIGCSTNVILANVQKLNKYGKIDKNHTDSCVSYIICQIFLLLSKADLLYIICKGLNLAY